MSERSSTMCPPNFSPVAMGWSKSVSPLKTARAPATELCGVSVGMMLMPCCPRQWCRCRPKVWWGSAKRTSRCRLHHFGTWRAILHVLEEHVWCGSVTSGAEKRFGRGEPTASALCIDVGVLLTEHPLVEVGVDEGGELLVVAPTEATQCR